MTRLGRQALLVLAVLALTAGMASAAAQQMAINPVNPVIAQPVVEGGGCTGAGWEIHDDGVPENGYGWIATVTDGRDADRFTPTSYPFTYTSVCVCWVRLGADNVIDFNVVVHDDDGPGGAPMTLLGSVPAQATAVPNALPGTLYQVDISSLNLNIPAGQVYIGAQWNASVDQQFFMCSDESVGTPSAGGQGSSDGATTWTPLGVLFPNYRSLLVRALGGPVGGGGDADLNVVKTGSYDGTNVFFTVTVTNNGPDGATGVVVTDILPPEVTYDSDDCGGSNVPPWTWNVGALANGASATCTITTTPMAGFTGSIANTAEVTGNENDPNPGDESSTANVAVGSVLEIPTLGTVGFALLALLLALGAVWAIRRRAHA